MSAAASAGLAVEILEIPVVMAAEVLAIILTVGPLGFLAVLASAWLGRFVKSARVAMRPIRRSRHSMR